MNVRIGQVLAWKNPTASGGRAQTVEVEGVGACLFVPDPAGGLARFIPLSSLTSFTAQYEVIDESA